MNCSLKNFISDLKQCEKCKILDSTDVRNLLNAHPNVINEQNHINYDYPFVKQLNLNESAYCYDLAEIVDAWVNKI